MNIYIYDAKKAKTEIIEIDDSKIEDNPDLEFFNDNDIRKSMVFRRRRIVFVDC